MRDAVGCGMAWHVGENCFLWLLREIVVWMNVSGGKGKGAWLCVLCVEVTWMM